MRPARWSINGRFLGQSQTGVQRYAGEIVRALDDLLSVEPQDDISFEILLPADCAIEPGYRAIASRRARYGRGQVWEQTVLPAMARGGLVNLANLGPIAHRRQIVCMHDANVYREPLSYATSFRLAYKTMMPLLARRAVALTTVSNYSAASLVEVGIVGKARPRVISNGHEHALRWNAAASPFSAPGRFRRPYVFALGSRARHKQIDLLLGLAPALDAIGVDLVISGGRSSIFADTGTVLGSPPTNIHAVGFVGDDDLAALFAGALCFAFPSRTEGFGLPLLEAMVHGAPIVASDCASMPEVCGEAALYAPPSRPDLWLNQITRLAQDEALRLELRQRGRARFPRFSWSTGARRYLGLMRQLSATRCVAEPCAATADRPAR